MRLPMFDVMDATAVLLDRRRDFYKGCAFELQELIARVLGGNELLSVNARVKKTESLREKVLRKHLYLEYDNPYDLLSNLSDLIGIRAECRFLREEAYLFELLCNACSVEHEDGLFSVPGETNIRFELSALQPQTQQNGLTIYRIDGRYHKNGVAAPFELQIKALVHVFWAEVEHQLIYKNNSYMLMDSFLKKLLYSNYDSLQQIDAHLQLIYDQMHTQSSDPTALRHANIRPVLAKTLSDLFLQQMDGQMGFSLRIDGICDILTQYLLARCSDDANPFGMLFDRIRNAAQKPMVFEEMLELGGAIDIEDPFCNTLGCHLAQLINTNYEWNLFFRLLFTLEDGSQIETFYSFLMLYRERFGAGELYAQLPDESIEPTRTLVLQHLSELFTEDGNVNMFSEGTALGVEDAIRRICRRRCCDPQDIRRRLRNGIEG